MGEKKHVAVLLGIDQAGRNCDENGELAMNEFFCDADTAAASPALSSLPDRLSGKKNKKKTRLPNTSGTPAAEFSTLPIKRERCRTRRLVRSATVGWQAGAPAPPPEPPTPVPRWSIGA